MNAPDLARRVIRLEIEQLERLHARVDERFTRAVELMRRCLDNRGKLIVCGVGKSGNIGRKLAATLNSPHKTTPMMRFIHVSTAFVHPKPTTSPW